MADTTATKHVTRESEARPVVWSPPERLATPTPPPGFTYVWVRYTLRGQPDEGNVLAHMRQGYEPVKATDIVDGSTYQAMDHGKHVGTIVSGDVMLFKVPDEILKQKREYYQQKTDLQMEAINKQLEAAGSLVMPISNESKSTVTVGKRPAFQE